MMLFRGQMLILLRSITLGILRFRLTWLAYGKGYFVELVILGYEMVLVAYKLTFSYDRVDIGTSEHLLLDVLINALTQISFE